MLKSVFEWNSKPENDGLNGSFSRIIECSSNLKWNIGITHNSEGDLSNLYEKILYFGGMYFQSWNKDEYPFINIEFKHHYIQITDFVIGEPADSCYSTMLMVFGTDDDNDGVFLCQLLNIRV